jgi:hypothetical protein
MDALTVDHICQICEKGFPSEEDELIVDHTPPKEETQQLQILEKEGNHRFHLSCIMAVFFEHAYCPVCKDPFPVPYDGHYFRILTLTKEQNFCFLRYFARKEWQAWKEKYCDLEEKSMLDMIEQSEQEERCRGVKKWDTLLLKAVWNGKDAVIKRLLEAKLATPVSLDHGLEVALRLDRQSIFWQIFEAHRVDGRMTVNILTKLLLLAATLGNSYLFQRILDSAEGRLDKFGAGGGSAIPAIKISCNVLHDALTKVLESPKPYNQESLKIVVILSRKLLEQAPHLLCQSLEKAIGEEDVPVIEVIIRDMSKRDYFLWKFFERAITEKWPKVVLERICSVPRKATWCETGDDWALSPISRAIKSENKEIGSLLLKWTGFENSQEVEELWGLLCKRSTGWEQLQLLRQRFKTKQPDKRIPLSDSPLNSARPDSLHPLPYIEENRVDVCQSDRQLQPAIGPLSLPPSKRWQRYWHGLRGWVASSCHTVFSCFRKMRCRNFFNCFSLGFLYLRSKWRRHNIWRREEDERNDGRIEERGNRRGVNIGSGTA